MGKKALKILLFLILLGTISGIIWSMMYQLNKEIKSQSISKYYSQIEKEII